MLYGHLLNEGLIIMYIPGGNMDIRIQHDKDTCNTKLENSAVFSSVKSLSLDGKIQATFTFSEAHYSLIAHFVVLSMNSVIFS